MTEEKARRVSMEVSIEGYDMAGAYAPYLLGFTFKDEAGGKSDGVQITLQNRDGRFYGASHGDAPQWRSKRAWKWWPA